MNRLKSDTDGHIVERGSEHHAHLEAVGATGLVFLPLTVEEKVYLAKGHLAAGLLMNAAAMAGKVHQAVGLLSEALAEIEERGTP